MLSVDEGTGAALLLGFGDDVQRERRLSRALGSVNLDDAPARQAANAERNVEPQRSRRDRLDIHGALAGAEAHNRALAEGLIDLLKRVRERLCLVLVHTSPFDDTKLR